MLIVLTINSCKKDRVGQDSSDKPLSIAVAKDFFETQVLPNSDFNKTNIVSSESFFKSMIKLADWDKASIKKISLQNAIIDPMAYDAQTFIATDPNGKKGINLDKLSYLMIYRNKQAKLQAEWVTYMPDSSWIAGNRTKFKGKIIVRDWNGNPFKLYVYHENGKVDSAFQRNIKNASINRNRYVFNSPLKYAFFPGQLLLLIIKLQVFRQQRGVAVIMSMKRTMPA